MLEKREAVWNGPFEKTEIGFNLPSGGPLVSICLCSHVGSLSERMMR